MRKNRIMHVKTFRNWASERIGPDGMAMNLASSTQLSTFLFGGSVNTKTKVVSESVCVFKTARADISDDAMEAYRERTARMKEEQEINEKLGIVDGSEGQAAEPEEDDFDQMKAAELKLICKEYGLKVSGKKAELQQRLRGHFQMMGDPDSKSFANIDDYSAMTVKDLRDACNARGLPASGKKAALVKELREDDGMMREISAEHMKHSNGADSSVTYRKISELLEEAVASGENTALKSILADIKARMRRNPSMWTLRLPVWVWNWTSLLLAVLPALLRMC